MEKGSKYKIPGKIIGLGNYVKRLRNMNMLSYGLTSAQSDAVMFILRTHRHKDVTASDIMDSLHLSQSTVAGIISRLEAKELIRRESHPEDSRINLLIPTEKGLELDDILRESAGETEMILLNGMSEQEMTELNRLLMVALDNIRSELDRKGEGNV